MEEFIKSRIKAKLHITDPEVYEKVVDQIYKFAMLLMYAPPELKRIAVETVFSVLPEDMVLNIITNYLDSLKRKHDKITSIVKSLMPPAMGGGSLENMFVNFMLEMYKKQFELQSGAVAESKPAEKVEIKEVPAELKKLLE